MAVPGQENEKKRGEQAFFDDYYDQLNTATNEQKVENTDITADVGGDYQNYLECQDTIDHPKYDGWPAYIEEEITQSMRELFDKKLRQQLISKEDQLTLMNKGMYWWDVVRVDGDTFINHLVKRYNEQIDLAHKQKSTFRYVFNVVPGGDPEISIHEKINPQQTPANLFKVLNARMTYDEMATEMASLMMDGKHRIEVPEVRTYDRGNLTQDQKTRATTYYEKKLNRDRSFRKKLVDLYNEGHADQIEIKNGMKPEEIERIDQKLISNVLDRVENFSQFSGNNLFELSGLKSVQVPLTKEHEKIERRTWGPLKRFGNWVARLWGGGKTKKEKQESLWKNDPGKEERQRQEKQEFEETIDDRVLNVDEVIRQEKQFIKDVQEMQQRQMQENEDCLKAMAQAREDARPFYIAFMNQDEVDEFKKVSREVLEKVETTRYDPEVQFTTLKNDMSVHIANAQRLSMYLGARTELTAISDVFDKKLQEIERNWKSDFMANDDVRGDMAQEVLSEEFQAGKGEKNVIRTVAAYKSLRSVQGRETVAGIKDYWFRRENDPKRAPAYRHMEVMRKGLLNERAILLAAKEALMTAALNGARSMSGIDKDNKILSAINEVSGKDKEKGILEAASQLLNPEQKEELLEKFKILNTQIEKYEKAIHAFSMNGMYKTSNGIRIKIDPLRYGEFLRQNTEGLDITSGLSALADAQDIMKEAVDKQYEDIAQKMKLPSDDERAMENNIRKAINDELAAARLCGIYADKAKANILKEDPSKQDMFKDFDALDRPPFLTAADGGLVTDNKRFDNMVANMQAEFEKEPKQVLTRHMDNMQNSILNEIHFGDGIKPVDEVTRMVDAWKKEHLGINGLATTLINMRTQYENLARPAKDFALASEDMTFTIKQMTAQDVTPEMFIAGFERLINLEVNNSWDPAQYYDKTTQEYRRMFINENEIIKKSLLNEDELKQYKECKTKLQDLIKEYQNTPADKRDAAFFRKPEYKQQLNSLQQLTLTALIRHDNYKALSGVLVTLGSNQKEFFDGKKLLAAMQDGNALKDLQQILGTRNIQKVAAAAFSNAMCMAKLCTDLLETIPTKDARDAVEDFNQKQKHMTFHDYGKVQDALAFMEQMGDKSGFQIAEQSFLRKMKTTLVEKGTKLFDEIAAKQAKEPAELSMEDKKEYAKWEHTLQEEGSPVSGAKQAYEHMLDKARQGEYLLNYQYLTNLIEDAKFGLIQEEPTTKLLGLFQTLSQLQTVNPELSLSNTDVVKNGMTVEKIGPDALKDQADKDAYKQCVETIKNVIDQMEKAEDVTEAFLTEDVKKAWATYCELTRKCVDSMKVFQDSGATQCVNEKKEVDVTEKFRQVSSAAVMYQRAGKLILMEAQETVDSLDVFDNKAMVDQNEIKEYSNLFHALEDDKLINFIETEEAGKYIDDMKNMDQVREVVVNEALQSKALEKCQELEKLKEEQAQTSNELSQSIGEEKLKQQLKEIDENPDLSQQDKKKMKQEAQNKFADQFKNAKYGDYKKACQEIDKTTDAEKLEAIYKKAIKPLKLSDNDKLPNFADYLKAVEAKALKDAFAKIFPGEKQDSRCAVYAECLDQKKMEKMSFDKFKALIHKKVTVEEKNPKTGKSAKVEKEIGGDLDDYINEFARVKKDGKTVFHKSYAVTLPSGEQKLFNRYEKNPIREIFLNVEKYVSKEVEMAKEKLVQQYKEKAKDATLKSIEKTLQKPKDAQNLAYLKLMVMNDGLKEKMEQANHELNTAVTKITEANQKLMEEQTLEQLNKKAQEPNKAVGDNKVAGDQNVAGGNQEVGGNNVPDNNNVADNQNKEKVEEAILM